MPRVVMTWTPQEIRPHCAVMVERWGCQNYGRAKRTWLATFNEQERKKLSAIHIRAYKWELRTGYPHEGIVMSADTYHLLTRAGEFFSTH